ncbi:MAG: LysR family transcriptional regulator [Sneathiella sp.]
MWDSYRFFLAVAETGSLSAAARQLSVSQPTVGRQIADLEGRIGTRLFNRASHGYTLTHAGAQIQTKIKSVAEDLAAAENLVEGLDQGLSGRIRISATEGFGSYWLTQKLAEFQAEYSEILIDLILDVEVLDVKRREADIAIRLTNPKEEELVGRRAGYVGFGFYASCDYLDLFGRPTTIAELGRHRFIDWNQRGNGFILSEALKALIGEAEIVFRTDTVAAQIEAVRCGVGIMVAPHYIARQFTDTEQLLKEQTQQLEELWILTHRDLQQIPRIRILLDYLFKAVKSDQDYFKTGTTSISL